MNFWCFCCAFNLQMHGNLFFFFFNVPKGKPSTSKGCTAGCLSFLSYVLLIYFLILSSLRLVYNGQTLISSAGNHFTPHSHPAEYEAINRFPNRSGSICKCHSAAVGETYSIWQEVVAIPPKLTSFFFYLIAGLMISRLPPTHEAMTSNWSSFPPLCEQHRWPGISGAELMTPTGCNLREDPDVMSTLSSVEVLLLCCFFFGLLVFIYI